jgi:hypothetical protein
MKVGYSEDQDTDERIILKRVLGKQVELKLDHTGLSLCPMAGYYDGDLLDHISAENFCNS